MESDDTNLTLDMFDTYDTSEPKDSTGTAARVRETRELLVTSRILQKVTHMEMSMESMERRMNERMSILEAPDQDKLEQYQLLKDAYEQYKAVEVLLFGGK